jgi:glyoxylase I family protein
VDQKLSSISDEAGHPAPLAIAAVLLFSDEPEELAGFYREALGVPLRRIRVPDADTHWACDLRGVYFSIWPASEVVTRIGESHRGGVAFHVNNVEREFERLKALGVRVEFPPRRTALGKIARLRDPDGNPFELFQPVPDKTDTDK